MKSSEKAAAMVIMTNKILSECNENFFRVTKTEASQAIIGLTSTHILEVMKDIQGAEETEQKSEWIMEIVKTGLFIFVELNGNSNQDKDQFKARFKWWTNHMFGLVEEVMRNKHIQ